MSDDDSLGPPWTTLKILRWTTGYFEDNDIASPRVDAEVLLADVLEMERIKLYAHFERELTDDELATYRQMVKRRAAREPCAYIVGHREFWNLDLAVDDRVLIPRPDTETLVRTVVDRLDEDEDGRLADIGTGCGAIALAVAQELPELQIAATDDEPGALEVAADNVETHGHDDRISLFEGDLFEALPDEWLPLDFAVSNPPYVADSEREQLQAEVRDFEPTEALMAGPDGLDVIRRLADEGRRAIAPGGWLYFEIGHDQGDATRELLEEAGWESVEIVLDYDDRDRVAVARNPED